MYSGPVATLIQEQYAEMPSIPEYRNALIKDKNSCLCELQIFRKISDSQKWLRNSGIPGASKHA